MVSQINVNYFQGVSAGNAKIKGGSLKKLTYSDITAKSVEISKCLINKGAGMYGYDLDATKITGDVARFAATIRQSDTLEHKQLTAIGTTLKIVPDTLKTILSELETMGWIETINKGGRVKKIDEHIPPLQDILNDLGKNWEEKEPTDIDRASVYSISYLSERPITRDGLLSELEIDQECFGTMLEYGEQTSYLGTFKSDTLDEEVVWTPFYWAGKMDKVLKFLNRNTYEDFNTIGSLTKNILDYQGRPLDRIAGNKEHSQFISAGISSGYFPSVAVMDGKGVSREYMFAATPQFGADPKNDIFEKARLIVACIRHGQYHAEISHIKYPVALLRALRENRLSPFSYGVTQYALLITNKICTAEKVKTTYGQSYKIKFIDTPENILASNIAEEMLAGDTPKTWIADEPEVMNLLVRGTFDYSAEQRHIKSSGQISATKEYSTLMEYMIGVRT